MDTLLGIKKNMTSTYDARGRRVGATVIEVTPNLVTMIKSEDGNDGYSAVQLGMGVKKNLKKPQLGHLKKANIEQNVRWFKEIRTTEEKNFNPGQQIKVSDIFSVGDEVKVTGVSKGKGFAGSVKRHGFAGGPKTHGQSDRHRAPGSIGSGTTPGRVLKGKKMAGHMGMDTVSVKGLEVVGIDRTSNLITIKGGLPGPVGGLLTIKKLGKIKGYTPPPEEKPDEEEEVKSDVEQMEQGGGVVEEKTEEAGAAAEEGSDEPKGDENA